mgnify:CR=1 FL=1
MTLQQNGLEDIKNSHIETLLLTAMVQIKSQGQKYDVWAIIDPACQSTFISENLKLHTQPNTVHVTGISEAVSETSTKICLINLCFHVNPAFDLDVWATDPSI